MKRSVTRRYSDPLDLIWVETAKAMGLTIERSGDSYASTDGRGTLRLSTPESMDSDDCLAQMILHEICHWLVQGRESLGWVDWGLDNEGTSDVEKEHACLRLQAALLAPFGLREALAPTTDFREYYDDLPVDPFTERAPSERESITRARAAFARRSEPPFRDSIARALTITADILRLAQSMLNPAAPGGELAGAVKAQLALHKVGLPLYPNPEYSCGDCAWLVTSEGEQRQQRCRQASGKHTSEELPACSHFELKFECIDCGACCREAYDAVEISRRDPASQLHRHLLVERSGGFDLARNGSRCACLRGGTELMPIRPVIHGGMSAPDAALSLPPLSLPSDESFTCEIYETRPKTCRDFTIYSAHCLYARRRVGLSR